MPNDFERFGQARIGYFESLGWDSERAAQYARIYEGRQAAAAKVLDSAEEEDFLWMEGSCPSGATFGKNWIWDGSPEMRAEILAEVFRHSHPDAWRETLYRRPAAETAAEKWRQDFRTACTTG